MKQGVRKEQEIIQEFRDRLDPITTQQLYDRRFVIKSNFESEHIPTEAPEKIETLINESVRPATKQTTKQSRHLEDNDCMSMASTAGGDAVVKSQAEAASGHKTSISLKSPLSTEHQSQQQSQHYRYRDWRDIYQNQ